ncbi:tRNA-dependent cyclodipeptide synthase [Vreelandella gomseomensis]|uniref:Cyclodipeptide synthase n=1 Tax=Vreelandella gomseomensis TaxID=370766 RepID=A0ABU1GC02_9GAMM|nr:tRNA-dependent cyclodipeptide synthase [Halomonas gomseomensis]MDR5874628.1 tRNA-dependent cyclodipeptide synthase [Halomonas gomseomensis]
MKEKHVLFGVSPFNSKFNDKYIRKMLEWGFENYSYVDVLHPHEEARYLLMGCGNKSNKAKKKSRAEFNRVERITNDYLEKSGHTLSSGKILKFSDFYAKELYKSYVEKIRECYEKNEEFYEICAKQTYKVINKRKDSTNKDGKVTQREIDIASEYIIREIPFLIAPSALLSTDNDIHISYYCSWPVADYLFDEKLPVSPQSATKIVIKDHAC